MTNPNFNGWAEDIIEVPCDLGYEGAIIPEEIYKGQGFEGVNMPPGMGVDSNEGRVVWNTDCLSADYGPGTQVAPSFRYGNSGSLSVIYEVANPSTTPTSFARENYR